MKRFIRILAIGLLCGIGLTAARSMLHLSRGVVWVALTVLFLGIFAVNYLYIRHYNNKIRAILPLLEQVVRTRPGRSSPPWRTCGSGSGETT